MKAASAEMIRAICLRFNIPIDRDHIIGHYQVYSAKPNCPAINKSIIDELIALANPPVVTPPPAPTPQPQVGEAIALMEQAIAKLKTIK